MPEPSTLLAAIHNGELAQSPAHRVIGELFAAGEVNEVIKIHEQPPLEPRIPTKELLEWRRFQGQLEKRWRAHLDRSSSLMDRASILNQVIYRAKLELSKDFLSRQSMARQVEQAVTAKHAASWQSFLDSHHAVLIVVESDATTTDLLIPALKTAKRATQDDQPTYVNLAGGLDASYLKIDHLMRSSIPGFVSFRRPVTNTSCAYAMNREFAHRLLSFVTDSPKSTQLGIDWLFNAFFLELMAEDASVTCLHADPPALIHGSLAGVTRSWHPDR